MIVFLSILLGVSVLGIVVGLGIFTYYDINNKKIENEKEINKHMNTHLI